MAISDSFLAKKTILANFLMNEIGRIEQNVIQIEDTFNYNLDVLPLCRIKII